ncbi:hypothetical protein U1Q18_032571, partial [Sarracenia purpurea var. burkii]
KPLFEEALIRVLRSEACHGRLKLAALKLATVESELNLVLDQINHNVDDDKHIARQGRTDLRSIKRKIDNRSSEE